MAANYFCAKTANDLEEDLFGTCPGIKYLLLLEEPNPWQKKAFADSKISEKVKLHLSDFVAHTPQTKLFLIRKDSRKKEKDFVLYLVKNEETKSGLKKFILKNYEDILQMDFQQFFSSEFPEFSGQPLYLVCTNGKHDKCCSKFGLPVFNQLKKADEENSWQCSHVGGDRFAPNILVIPYIIYYGNVILSDLEKITKATNNQKVFLEKWRGRSCYSMVEQAAEYYLRKQLHNLNIFDFVLINSEEIQQRIFEITFKNIQSGEFFYIKIKQGRSEIKRKLTCHATKEGYPKTYSLVN